MSAGEDVYRIKIAENADSQTRVVSCEPLQGLPGVLRRRNEGKQGRGSTDGATREPMAQANDGKIDIASNTLLASEQTGVDPCSSRPDASTSKSQSSSDVRTADGEALVSKDAQERKQAAFQGNQQGPKRVRAKRRGGMAGTEREADGQICAE